MFINIIFLSLLYLISLEVYYGEIIKEEQDIDDDEDQEYFWDDVVEPVFTILQERLDKVMREI